MKINAEDFLLDLNLDFSRGVVACGKPELPRTFVGGAQSQSQEAAAAQSESREMKEHYLRTSAAAQRQLDRILSPFSLCFIMLIHMFSICDACD